MKVEQVNFQSLIDGNRFFQSPFWTRFEASLGWTPIGIRGLSEERSPFSLVCLTRKLGGCLPIACVLHGPQFHDASPPEEMGPFLQQLARAIQEFLPLGTLFLRFNLLEEGSSCAPLRRFSPSLQAPSSTVLELNSDTPELLASMKKKTRENIRMNTRKGISVREGSLADLPAWYAIYRETLHLRSPKNSLHDLRYFESLFSQPRASDHVTLFLSFFEKELLSGIICGSFGEEAVYLWGASHANDRAFMSSYALQWHAIKWAKERGCTTYSFGRTADLYGGETSNQSTQPSQLQCGFGGKMVHHLGTWDAPYSRVVYPIYALAERTREKVRNLFSRGDRTEG